MNFILTELGKRGDLSFTLPSGEEILTNEEIERASVEESPDANGILEFVVRLDLNEEGAKKFSEATGGACNVTVFSS